VLGMRASQEDRAPAQAAAYVACVALAFS
jgi:hypothetical protein